MSLARLKFSAYAGWADRLARERMSNPEFATSVGSFAGQRRPLRLARRAAELVRCGVLQAAINIQGLGNANPLVSTSTGVREPQNRRVEIILQ